MKISDLNARCLGTEAAKYVFGPANPDYTDYAESLGINGYSPQILPELRETLQNTITSRRLCMVGAWIDPLTNFEPTEKSSISREKN